MAQFPGLTIWTDAWIADTHHLTGQIGMAKIGAYISLLIVMWRTPGCRVPNDDVWLMDHLHLSVDEVRELLRPVIAEYCQTDGNWITQKRLKREFVRRFELGAAQSVRAKHRENNKKNRTREAPPGGAPYSTATASKKASFSTSSSFPTAAKEETENSSARSFATASNGDALAREPDSELAERKRWTRKNPEEMTLAEINVHWRGNGRYP